MKSTEDQLIHDLRNVATIVRGAAETLHNDGPSLTAEMANRVTTMLARRSDMLVRLIDDLSTVHGLNSGSLFLQLQAVDLAEAFEDLVTDHQELADAGITIEIGPGATVLADPMRLAQVIDNLLTNARRYGGSSVVARAERAGAEVVITVHDDGSGVDPKIEDSMFEEHTRGTTSQLFGGTGLGLAIVRELCTAMGGSVTYEHEVGTTFTVRLPAVPATSVDLGRDAAAKGHSVSFWKTHDVLAETIAAYAAHGLVAGEGVVLALTEQHHRLVEERLRQLGLDVTAAQEHGQYLAIDAAEVRAALEVDGHVDPDRYDEIIGSAVRGLDERWQRFRAFGEIVDLYWRDGDYHLALELESCWNHLRSQVEFPLYCAYELTSAQDDVCGCHDAVLLA